MANKIIAIKENVGRVDMCGHCQEIQLTVNRATICLTLEEFMGLSLMMREAVRHPKICMTQENPASFMGSQLFSRD